MKLQNTWWPEKYRPKTLSEFVGNADFVQKVQQWVEKNDVPNMILYSEKSGTGKSTACKLIASLLDADVKYINASSENSIDVVRDVIDGFAKTSSFKRWKIVILDEFSYFSKNGQSAILSVIESTSATTRFFLTGNYIDKFLPAIVSRCHPFLIQSPPPKQIFSNLSRILNLENIQFNEKDLAQIIKQYYPDQRGMLNYCQINSLDGILKFIPESIVVNDYCSKILEELKNLNRSAEDIFKSIRQIVADAQVRQFDDLFKFLFDNLDEFAPNGKKSAIILTLADYQYKSNLVIDREIPVMAMIVNILTELKS